MVPKKVHGQNISGQKPCTHPSSAPAAQNSSCSPHVAALHFAWGNEKCSEENEAALAAEGRAEELLWARQERKAWAPLCCLGTACSVPWGRLRAHENMNQWLENKSPYHNKWGTRSVCFCNFPLGISHYVLFWVCMLCSLLYTGSVITPS